jgi:hypothetical protein
MLLLHNEHFLCVCLATSSFCSCLQIGTDEKQFKVILQAFVSERK